MATAAKYEVRVGKIVRSAWVATGETIQIDRIEDASTVCDKMRAKLNVGASRFPSLMVAEVLTGRIVAKVSYNGRLWNLDETPYIAEVRP